jgi:oxalate decarboxylase/phosphoglucose isomerase-like protein (cupin superfamily)
MPKLMLSVLVISFALSTSVTVRAQGRAPAARPAAAAATYVTSAEVQSVAQKTATLPVSDQAIRIVNINGEYNVAVGVVHRAKTVGQPTPNGIEHSQITEIYHVIEGSGTLVTGGTLENPTPAAADSPTVTLLNGPSTNGGAIRNGVSRTIGPGDVVIIPPNTPHWFSNVSSTQIVYLILRVDPHKVLPAGYMPPSN